MKGTIVFGSLNCCWNFPINFKVCSWHTDYFLVLILILCFTTAFMSVSSDHFYCEIAVPECYIPNHLFSKKDKKSKHFKNTKFHKL